MANALDPEGSLIEDGDLAIRRLRDIRDDYERMVRWRNMPHVREWWDPDDPDLTFDDAVKEYRALTSAEAETTGCVILYGGMPIGFVQFCSWDGYRQDADEIGFQPGSNWWGVDIFIGEPGLVGHGIGSRAVRLVAGYLAQSRGAKCVALTTEIENTRAIRAYEKAGFKKEKQVLDTDTRDGQRVRSWLMVYRVPSASEIP